MNKIKQDQFFQFCLLRVGLFTPRYLPPRKKHAVVIVTGFQETGRLPRTLYTTTTASATADQEIYHLVLDLSCPTSLWFGLRTFSGLDSVFALLFCLFRTDHTSHSPAEVYVLTQQSSSYLVETTSTFSLLFTVSALQLDCVCEQFQTQSHKTTQSKLLTRHIGWLLNFVHWIWNEKTIG